MSYRPIVDKDEEQAKGCLDCGKIFYVGEVCPFCVMILPYCAKCHRIEINGKKLLPLNAFVAIKKNWETMEAQEAGSSKKIRIKFEDVVCEECKTDELCATLPIAICNER